MKNKHQVLFTPAKIGSCEIKNRFVIGYCQGAPFEAAPNIHIIEDASKISNLKNAVWQANDLAITI